MDEPEHDHLRLWITRLRRGEEELDRLRETHRRLIARVSLIPSTISNEKPRSTTMLDIPSLVDTATHRAHSALCTDQEHCSGPSEIEMMITAYVLEATLPNILAAISQEFKQALHSMSAGHSGQRAEPDALAEDPEELVAEWFRYWNEDPEFNEDVPPNRLSMRTAAFLTARAVQQGKPIRSVSEL